MRATNEILAEEGWKCWPVCGYPSSDDNGSPQQLFYPSPEFQVLSTRREMLVGGTRRGNSARYLRFKRLNEDGSGKIYIERPLQI